MSKKIIILFLFSFFSMNAFSAERKVLGISCDGVFTSLAVSEGRLINSGNEISRIKDGMLWNELKEFVLSHTDIKSNEQKTLLNSLNKLKSSFEVGSTRDLPTIEESDILIDRRAECTYKTIISFNGDDFFFSKEIYHKSEQTKYNLLLEALFISLSKGESAVGMRSLVYALITKDYYDLKELEKLKKYQNAGITFFSIGSTRIDLNRKFHFDESTGEVFAGYPFKKETVYFAKKNCLASTKQPILFKDSKINKVLVADKCSLVIGGQTYSVKRDSFITIRDHGTFSNDPIEPYIESIYLTPGVKIENSNVDFIASFDPDRPSKIVFSFDGRGVQSGFIQFLGSVWVNGEKRKIKDYSNASISNETGKISLMVLSEPFEYSWTYGSLSISGIVRLSSGGLLEGVTSGDENYLLLPNGIVKVLKDSPISFHPNNNNQAWHFTLSEDSQLLIKTGEVLQLYRGERVSLDKDQFVYDIN